MKIRAVDLLSMPQTPTPTMIAAVQATCYLSTVEVETLYQNLIKGFTEDIRDGVVEIVT